MKIKLHFEIIILFLFTTISIKLYSQKPPAKFGKISIEELETQNCPIDSSAHAYFIFDYGKSHFQYADNKISSDNSHKSQKGFQLYFTRHFRLKIVDNQAFPWANIKIPLYQNGDKERIVKIRACTYNLKNNQITKTKLNTSDIFKEETNKYWSTKKFAMPDVREGSIIEIEYTIKSDYYFNLREWYFQKTIPVLQSEYHVSVPEYFIFNQTQKGYFPIQTENDIRYEKLTLTYHQKAEGIAVEENTYSKTFEYRVNTNNFYAREIPAFPIEKHLRTKENYISKLEFELRCKRFPNTPIKNYTSSWEKINYNLLEDDRFGQELINRSHLKDDVRTYQDNHNKDISLLYSAFNHIKEKMVWNGFQSKYVTSTLRKAYKEGSGNCADINLNLILFLRELGFETYPLVLSTQDNGIIHPSHPSISKFDYVIAMAKLGNDTLLLDATDPYSEINLLPIRCLNGKGRIINDTGGDWLTLMDYKSYSATKMYKIDINEDLSFNTKEQLLLNDYAAYINKKEIKRHNNIEEYKTTFENENRNRKINKFEITGLESMQPKMKIIMEFVQDNYIERSKEIAFLKPVFEPFISENPFKLEKRDYPVEFNFPYNVKQMYSISIPENYFITDIPQSLTIESPDGEIRYTYKIKQMGNKIILSVMFRLRKTLFLPEDYQTLKSFYQRIINKQNELITIKKSA